MSGQPGTKEVQYRRVTSENVIDRKYSVASQHHGQPAVYPVDLVLIGSSWYEGDPYRRATVAKNATEGKSFVAG